LELLILTTVLSELSFLRECDVFGMCSGSNLPVPVININLQNVATYWSRVNGVSVVEVMGGGFIRKRSFLHAGMNLTLYLSVKF
jgi:hypothetical protein